VIARLSHPTGNNVHEGLDSDKENGSDLIVALGGETLKSAAKAAALLPPTTVRFTAMCEWNNHARPCRRLLRSLQPLLIVAL
jgi:alcohol dehydrogenase class IV